MYSGSERNAGLLYIILLQVQILQHVQMVQHGDELLHIIFAEFFQDRVDLRFDSGELDAADLTDLGSCIAAGHHRKDIQFGLCQLRDNLNAVEQAVLLLFDALKFVTDFAGDRRTDRRAVQISARTQPISSSGAEFFRT